MSKRPSKIAKIGLTGSELWRRLEAWAPASTAEDWDNVGVLAGSLKSRVRSVVVSIDLDAQALEAAARVKADAILTHHPAVFPGGSRARGLLRLRPEHPLVEASRQRLLVIAAHTNFDRSVLEAPLRVARGLKFEPEGRLLSESEGSLRKLSVFVPVSHFERVERAVFDAGAGQIGRYRDCGFSSLGQGSFTPGEQARPFLGKTGMRTRVEELRFETIFPTVKQHQVLAALKAAHPYEEIAFDVWDVNQRPSPQAWVSGVGYGVVGRFPRAKVFSDVIRGVKTLFALEGAILTDVPRGKTSRKIKRLAFSPGKGSSFVAAAIEQGVELFVTGEVGYHAAREAAERGTAVLEIGHRESERFFLEEMSRWAREQGLRVKTENAPLQRWN